MKFPLRINGYQSAAALLVGIVTLCLNACQPPPEKPIPPLNPTKLPVEPQTTAPTASTPVKPGQLTRMPLGDLYRLVQREAVLVYDVRPLIYYKIGHVPGAISWPKKDFDRYYDKQAPNLRLANKNNTPVVFYCTDLACPDGLAVAEKLVARGHTVSVLQGGYEAWKTAIE